VFTKVIIVVFTYVNR